MIAPDATTRRGALARAVTFGRLEAVSFTHSMVYLGLLICAFALGNPEPETFVLGMAHGLLWIGMSLVCLAAARARIIPFWLAVTVAVLGGLGPFAGTIGFVAEGRRRRDRAEAAAADELRYGASSGGSSHSLGSAVSPGPGSASNERP